MQQGKKHGTGIRGESKDNHISSPNDKDDPFIKLIANVKLADPKEATEILEAIDSLSTDELMSSSSELLSL